MYNKQVYYKDDDCKVMLEEVEGHLFVHVALNSFSKKILLKLLKVWAEIKAKCYWSGYEAIYTYTKDNRITKFFPGAKMTGKYNYMGERYEVLQWDLN